MHQTGQLESLPGKSPIILRERAIGSPAEIMIAYPDQSAIGTDRHNRIVYVKNPDGYESVYGYDTHGNLNRIKNRLGAWSSQDGGKTWTDARGNRSSIQFSLDANGNLHSVYTNGTVENISRSGMILRKFANGAEETTYTGGQLLRPDERFHKIKDGNGQVSFLETNGKVLDFSHDAQISQQRDRLLDLARTKINNSDELAKFEVDMARFENRSKKLVATYKLQGENDDQAQKHANREIAATYQHLSRLFDDTNTRSPYDQRRRNQIAEQVIAHAANPTLVDQGNRPTCNVTDVEVRTYMRNPAEATRLVVDVATTGRYVTTKEPRTLVFLDAGSLRPDTQSQKHPPVDGERGLASQIFQLTAGNIYYTTENNRTNPPGQVRYEQDPAQKFEERVIDYSQNPPKVINKGFIGAASCRLMEIGSQITGDPLPRDGGYEWFITSASSEAELHQKLIRLKQNGQLPATIYVDTNNEPFYTDSGEGTAGGSGGGHVVNVLDYEPGPPCKLAIDSTWGSTLDHDKNGRVDLHELYMAMCEPTSTDRIDDRLNDVQAYHRNSVIDYRSVNTELDVLRTRMHHGHLDNAQYANLMIIRMATLKRYHDEGKLDGAAYETLSKKMRNMIQELPWDEQFSLVEKERASGLITEKRYLDDVA